jgi:hypothetical protein
MDSILTKLVEEKIKERKGEHLSSFGKKRINALYKEIKSGEITAGEVTYDLKKEEKLNCLKDKDFSEIEKEVSRMLKK